MAAMRFLLFSLVITVFDMTVADDIDRAAQRGAVAKMVRAMTNQTQQDTLNLPANSTLIRENITDTFSCENRTYGYYADVDNDCQVFHVCYTRETYPRHNVTYRWSFICPGETIFNQEHLVCARPIDSVKCEEAPMYYDKNLEFGKVNKTTNESQSSNNNTDNSNYNKNYNYVKKRNIIIENIMKDKIIEDLFKDKINDFEGNYNKADNFERIDPKLDFTENGGENQVIDLILKTMEENEFKKDVTKDENVRKGRFDDIEVKRVNKSNGGRKSRNFRGTFKFKADVLK